MRTNLLQSPIFVIGNPRSGTTLLRLMLNSHRDILVPPECGFAVWWYDKYKHWDSSSAIDNSTLSDFLNDLRSSRKIETWNLDYNKLKHFIIDEHPASYADLVSTVYIFYGISIGRKFKRWGDKNNFYLKHINLIKQLYPPVYFIHIIRDGRDVACSYTTINKNKFNSIYAPRLPKTIIEIAKEWVTNVSRIRNSFNIFDWENVLEIKYEDLVVHPHSVLKKICSFLKQPYYRSMLEYYKSPNKLGNEPEAFLEWKGKIMQKASALNVGQYKRELNLKDLNIFNSVSEKILKIYNYEL